MWRTADICLIPLSIWLKPEPPSSHLKKREQPLKPAGLKSSAECVANKANENKGHSRVSLFPL